MLLNIPVKNNAAFLLLNCVLYEENSKGGPAMANYGKYYIAVRLLLLK